jgi:Predicted aminomethyltransferase related to GcvT
MRTMRQLQEELGGTFRDLGENQPEHFGDASTEVQAARESAIVVDRSGRGKLLFTGEDRASFLHGMLTNTVEGLEDGDGNHAALTDAKGSTRADMWVYHWGDSLAMETEPGLQSAVSEFL